MTECALDKDGRIGLPALVGLGVGAVLHGRAFHIRLRFNSRIDHRRSRLVLLDPVGKETAVTFDPH